MPTYISPNSNSEFFSQFLQALPEKYTPGFAISFVKDRGFTTVQRSSTTRKLEDSVYKAAVEALDELNKVISNKLKAWTSGKIPAVPEIEKALVFARKFYQVTLPIFCPTDSSHNKSQEAWIELCFRMVSLFCTIINPGDSKNEKFVESFLEKPNTPSLIHSICDTNNSNYASHLACGLIDHGFDVHTPDWDGSTPLITTCRYGLEKAALKLLAREMDVNAKDKKGNTALIFACREGMQELVAALLAKGADITCANHKGATALNQAPIHRPEIILEKLLEHGIAGCSLENKTNVFSHFCVNFANEAILLSFVNAGIDYNSVSLGDKNTPLHSVCLEQWESVALAMIDKEAPIDALNIKNQTALMIACEQGLEKVALRLIEKRAKITPADYLKNTALHYALQSGMKKVAIKLIQAGAPLQGVNTSRHSLLDIALKNAQLLDAMILLAERGVTCASTGETLLHIACKQGKLKVAQTLLPKVDYSQKDYFGKTPFQSAFDSNFWESSPEKMRAFFIHFFSCFGVIEQDLDLNTIAQHPETLFNHPENKPGMHPLELAFLFQRLPLTRAIASQMTEKDYAIQIQKIAEKYPKSSLDHLSFALYETTQEHLKVGVEYKKIPSKPEGVKSASLIDLFSEIDFSNPGNPLYQEPEAFLKKAQVRSFADLEKNLKNLISIIELKKPIRGAPKEGSANFLAFYKTLDDALCHVIHALKNMEDQEMAHRLKIKACAELIRISGICAGGIFPAVIKLYLEVVDKKIVTFEEELHSFLAEFRSVIFHSVLPVGPQTVHNYNRFMKTHGVKLGIIGAQLSSEFDDIYVGQEMDYALAEEAFFTAYAPAGIINEWLYQEYAQNGDHRDAIIDWSKKQIPATWGNELYEPICKELVHLEEKNSSREEISAFLGRHQILLGLSFTPQEAVEDDRVRAYLEAVVTEYDETTPFRIRKSYFPILLTKLNIFKQVVQFKLS